MFWPRPICPGTEIETTIIGSFWRLTFLEEGGGGGGGGVGV